MGAIAGVVYPDVFQITDLLRPMLKMLRRRCQKPNTVHNWKNIQVGAAGHPIAVNDKHTVLAAIDGVIYNADSLWSVLEEKGFARDENVARLIVSAYEAFGTSFLEQIEGDFALVVLDENNSQLLLARDRIGKKPLYWYHDHQHFLFASEIQALLATGAVPQTPATDGMAAYLSLGYIAQDVTAIEGVSRLLPGHYLILRPNQHKTIHSYWSYSSLFTSPRYVPPPKVAEHVNILLQAAVKERLPASADPVGCFISGGLGSASIAYYVHMLRDDNKIEAFSAGFEKENNDDLRIASQVATALSFPQNVAVINTKDVLNDLVKVIWHLGEPIADPNILMTWSLASLAAEGSVQTVFSGMGSDELLAGHTRYTFKESGEHNQSWFQRIQQPIKRNLIVPLLNAFFPSASLEMLRDCKTNPWQAQYLHANALFDEKLLREASPALSGLFDPTTFLHKFHQLAKIKSIVSSFLYFDVKTRLPDCYVMQLDRLTSAFGLDWKAPYLSNEIVEYLAGVPEPEQLAVDDTASCLKAILKSHLPESVIRRPKVSRPHFLESWTDDPILAQAFELLRQGNCVDTGLISSSWLSENLETPQKRKQSFKFLWAVMVLEIWLRLFIVRPIRSEPPEITLLDFLSE